MARLSIEAIINRTEYSIGMNSVNKFNQNLWLSRSKAVPLCSALLLLGLMSSPLRAADYNLDPTHSFIEWRVQHLGYSWLYGRFNDIQGRFSWDAAEPQQASIEVEIDTASIDSNHATRDRHLRGKKYLHSAQFSKASFKSLSYKGDESAGELEGELTLHGISKVIRFRVERLGEGPDPWLGYRAGFIGHTSIDRRDFDITEDIGPDSFSVELILAIEGIRIPKRAHKPKNR